MIIFTEKKTQIEFLLFVPLFWQVHFKMQKFQIWRENVKHIHMHTRTHTHKC